MKLAKSLLLGSAAGIVAVTGAQAADLPVRAAAPVDYVRICPFTQPGFGNAFVIPGTDTCLQISGYVRAEYVFGADENERLISRDAANSNDVDFRAKGFVRLDARTPTQYGTLRSFLSFDSDADVGNGGQNVFFDEAFIQFAGFTAGRVGSFFDYRTGEMMGTNIVGGDGPTTEVFAYTATFGAGFSASIALEEAFDARIATAGALFAPGIAAGVYGNQSLPNLVANLNVSQAWGSAQVMAAIQQNRHNVGGANNYDDELGYAIGGGVTINLPMIAAGDRLWLQATYAQGAIRYLDGGGFNGGRISVNNPGDFQLNTVTQEIEQTEGWVIAGAFVHNWTSQLAQRFQASYGAIDVDTDPVGVTLAGATRATVADGTVQDFTFWTLGTRLDYSVVPGLVVSGEVQYLHYDTDIPVFTNGVTTVNGEDDDDVWEGRIRIERAF